MQFIMFLTTHMETDTFSLFPELETPWNGVPGVHT
jgi:hypothetical protein